MPSAEELSALPAAELAVRDRGAELPEDPEGRHALFAASNKEISEPEHFEEVAVESVRGLRLGDGGDER